MHAYQPDRLNDQTNSSPNIIVATVLENPALSAGALFSIIVTAIITINAVWFQSGKHPAPMFSTRNVEAVRPLTDKASNTAKPASRTKTASLKSLDQTTSRELLQEVQAALSVRGYYTGKLDGVYGSRTRKAINNFQRDHSLEPDGKATVRLLTQVLMSASARPKEVPVPKPAQVAKTETPSTEQAAVNTQAVEDAVNGLVARIQSGLKAYGYDDLIVDGKMGQHTATAIQRFQLDYGMKITGEPSDGVLKKLREIGAYTQG